MKEIIEGKNTSLMLPNVTRVEIHRNGEHIASDWNSDKVEVYIQDLGHTLKIFYQADGEDVVWPFGANYGAKNEEELQANIKKVEEERAVKDRDGETST